MSKLVIGILVGAGLVLGMGSIDSTSYIIQKDGKTAISECGCTIESRWGFDGSVGDEIIDFGGCKCDK